MLRAHWMGFGMKSSWYLLYREKNANIVFPVASREMAMREARRLVEAGITDIEIGPLRPGSRRDLTEIDWSTPGLSP